MVLGDKHSPRKGPYFKDLVLNKDLFGILGPYWVLIYISGSLFSLFWLHSRKECQNLQALVPVYTVGKF